MYVRWTVDGWYIESWDGRVVATCTSIKAAIAARRLLAS